MQVLKLLQAFFLFFECTNIFFWFGNLYNFFKSMFLRNGFRQRADQVDKIVWKIKNE